MDKAIKRLKEEKRIAAGANAIMQRMDEIDRHRMIKYEGLYETFQQELAELNE